MIAIYSRYYRQYADTYPTMTAAVTALQWSAEFGELMAHAVYDPDTNAVHLPRNYVIGLTSQAARDEENIDVTVRTLRLDTRPTVAGYFEPYPDTQD